MSLLTSFEEMPLGTKFVLVNQDGTIKYDPAKAHECIFTKASDNDATYKNDPWGVKEKGRFQPVSNELEVMPVETDTCEGCGVEHILMNLEYVPEKPAPYCNAFCKRCIESGRRQEKWDGK